MEYEFRVQDPSAATTVYLFEELIAQIGTAAHVDALFAFASRAGVLNLIGDPITRDFLRRGGTARLLVGLDAITDRQALEALVDIQAEFPGFKVFVFKNVTAKLFHPKVVRTARSSGAGAVVVGSGNLTPGGLRDNIEAYSVFRFKKAETPDFSAWDDFYTRHVAEITAIDVGALERGDRNRLRATSVRTTARGAPASADEKAAAAAAATEGEQDAEAPLADLVPDLSVAARMLVAEVPRAAGRWHQIHFNRDVSQQFFRAAPGTSERVFLRRLDGAGSVVLEPPRPVVLSAVNLNHKIEFGAHHGDPYPAAGRPVLVIRELGLRQFLYVMLMPGDAGHAEMNTFLAANPSLGRGLRRVISDRATVRAAWPGLPI